MFATRKIAIALSFCLGMAACTLARADDRPAQWAQPVDSHYNLYQMSPTLYRSALPDAQALPLLDKLKVKTVVNLLPEPDNTWLTTPGVTQVQLPMRTVHVDDADIIASLRAIQQAETQGPVLLHCKHGLDRTGLVSAMYRVVIQGWTKQAAIEEMTQGGFGDAKRVKYGIAYINGANVEDIRSALASGACSTSPLAACAIKGLFKGLT